jgi:predicted nucleotidyltransferase
MGAERIICLMSGNAVQRGDLAIMPKNLRARSAVEAGADAVFELPFPYSAGSAEFFASAGVDILARLGVDTVAFGSESGDINALRNLAAKAEDFKPSEDKNIGTALDYFSALGSLRSNDILGVEYLKAGKKFAPDMDFVTVKREGAGYHDDAEDGAYPSATEIRREIFKGGIGNYSDNQLPNCSKFAIQEAFAENTIASMKNVQSAILYFWRTADIAQVAQCAECGGGVAERLAVSAKDSKSFEEMMSLAATKRYTDSRLRRAVIFGMLGVTLEDLKRPAEYVNLLAANAKGIEFVSAVGNIAVISKPSKVPQTEAGIRQFEIGQRLDVLYTLAMDAPRESGYFLKQSPRIIKN